MGNRFMNNHEAITHVKKTPTELANSIEKWILRTTDQSLKRVADITRDKTRAVKSFFALIEKQPDKVTSRDVIEWHQVLLDRGHSERYIYANLSHLSSYYEYLMKTDLARFLKVNPVKLSMPKAPRKYNSPKAKSLSDEQLSRLWLTIENLAKDDTNKMAVRDYAIFRLFMATGMRREEIISLGAEDIQIENSQILVHARVKGGTYEWRTIDDEEVKAAIERYLILNERRSLIGQHGSALWIRFDRAAKAAEEVRRHDKPKGGEVRLSSHGFDQQMKKYAHEVGIEKFHLHQLRHTFARIVGEVAGSLQEVQEALGHKDLATTQIYLNRIKFKKDKYSRSIRDRIKPREEFNADE